MTESATDVIAYPAPRAHPFDPPPLYNRLRLEKPVIRVRLSGDRHAWLVTRYDDTRMVLSDPRFSSDRRHPNFPATLQGRTAISKLPPVLISLDGEEHGRARRAVLGEFTVRRTEQLRPRIQEITDSFIDEMLAGPRPVDLVEALAMPVPSLTICEQLGVPYEDRNLFQDLTMKLVRHTTTEEERPALVKEFRGYLSDLIASKEDKPGDDLFSRQVEQQRREQGHVDRENLVGLGFMLLLAGHETTGSMISLGTLALLENPDQLAMIKKDPSLIPMAVEELLRYFTIVEHVTARIATTDIEINGVTIPKDDAVIVSGPAADRDETVFPDPDRLDITRNARHHLAFGYGPHQCIGQNVARLELQIVFATLFRRIPGLRLAVDFSELPFKHDANFYGLYELPVTW